MARATLTQREIVRRLLTSGKLTAVEQSAFQAIYEDLAAGKTTELTRQQQLWAERLYYWTHKLGEERVEVGKKRGNARREEQLAAFDAMPRPKKPPGKR
jgi:hypothetical protein